MKIILLKRIFFRAAFFFMAFMVSISAASAKSIPFTTLASLEMGTYDGTTSSIEAGVALPYNFGRVWDELKVIEDNEGDAVVTLSKLVPAGQDAQSGFIACWQDLSNDETFMYNDWDKFGSIKAQRFDPGGSKIWGKESIINPSSRYYASSLQDMIRVYDPDTRTNRFIIAQIRNNAFDVNNLIIQRIDDAGNLRWEDGVAVLPTATGHTFNIFTDTLPTPDDAALAASADGKSFYIAWFDSTSGKDKIYLRKYNAETGATSSNTALEIIDDAQNRSADQPFGVLSLGLDVAGTLETGVVWWTEDWTLQLHFQKFTCGVINSYDPAPLGAKYNKSSSDILGVPNQHFASTQITKIATSENLAAAIGAYQTNITNMEKIYFVTIATTNFNSLEAATVVADDSASATANHPESVSIVQSIATPETYHITYSYEGTPWGTFLKKVYWDNTTSAFVVFPAASEPEKVKVFATASDYSFLPALTCVGDIFDDTEEKNIYVSATTFGTIYTLSTKLKMEKFLASPDTLVNEGSADLSGSTFVGCYTPRYVCSSPEGYGLLAYVKAEGRDIYTRRLNADMETVEGPTRVSPYSTSPFSQMLVCGINEMIPLGKDDHPDLEDGSAMIIYTGSCLGTDAQVFEALWAQIVDPKGNPIDWLSTANAFGSKKFLEISEAGMREVYQGDLIKAIKHYKPEEDKTIILAMWYSDDNEQAYLRRFDLNGTLYAIDPGETSGNPTAWTLGGLDLIKTSDGGYMFGLVFEADSGEYDNKRFTMLMKRDQNEHPAWSPSYKIINVDYTVAAELAPLTLVPDASGGALALWSMVDATGNNTYLQGNKGLLTTNNYLRLALVDGESGETTYPYPGAVASLGSGIAGWGKRLNEDTYIVYDADMEYLLEYAKIKYMLFNSKSVPLFSSITDLYSSNRGYSGRWSSPDLTILNSFEAIACFADMQGNTNIFKNGSLVCLDKIGLIRETEGTYYSPAINGPAYDSEFAIWTTVSWEAVTNNGNITAYTRAGLTAAEVADAEWKQCYNDADIFSSYKAKPILQLKYVITPSSADPLQSPVIGKYYFNYATAATGKDIMEPTALAIDGDYAFSPKNGEEGQIFYTLAEDATIDIMIFSTTGIAKRIRTAPGATRVFSDNVVGSGGTKGFNVVSWDGKNDTGELLGNGIYPVKIIKDGKQIAKLYLVIYD